MDLLSQISAGFRFGVKRADPYHMVLGARSAVDDDFGTIFSTLRHDEGLFSALGYAGSSAFGAMRGAYGALRGTLSDAFNVGNIAWPSIGARIGYGAGVGLMLGGPILAGAAAYSGLNNLRHGRFGRAALQLAAGAGLVAAMYGAHRRFGPGA